MTRNTHRAGIVRGRSALLLALAALLCACSPSKDAAAPAAERVVCVSKQINELMFAIGAQGVIVGRDLTSVYPPEIKQLTSVGYHRALSAEGILSLKPTLFLTDGNVGPDEVMAQIEKAGVPILKLEPGKTPEDAEALLLELGKRFRREEAAQQVLARWKKDMTDVLAESAKWSSEPKPRVLVMHFGQVINNYLGIKPGGVADQVLHWAGAENAVTATDRGMLRLTPELIAQAAPDIIVATDVGFDRFGTPEKFAAMPGVDLTPAGKAGKVFRIEETDVMYFGPRTPEAIRRLAGFFHPAPQA